LNRRLLIHQLGVTVIWLSPHYDSPNADNGYDIRDYRKIMKEFGTMADFDRMLAAIKKRHMRLIIDLVATTREPSRLNRLGPRNLPHYFSCLLRLIAADSYIGLRDHSDQSTVIIDHRNASHLVLLHRIQGSLQVVVRATRQRLPRHYILHLCAAGIAVFGDDL
jgi:hypothetical protein